MNGFMMKIVNISDIPGKYEDCNDGEYYINSNRKSENCNNDNCLLCDHIDEYCSICIDDNIINMLNKAANEEDILI